MLTLSFFLIVFVNYQLIFLLSYAAGTGADVEELEDDVKDWADNQMEEFDHYMDEIASGEERDLKMDARIRIFVEKLTKVVV